MMNIKEKIAYLKERLKKRTSTPVKAIGVALAFSFTPTVSQGSQTSQTPNTAKENASQNISVDTSHNNNLLLEEEITLSIAELQQLKEENNLDIPVEWLSKILPGSSYEGVSGLIQKGFRFNTTRNGIKRQHICSIKQKPKGYCYGAMKHVLEQKFQVKKAPHGSAYQEKDHLLQQSNFLAVRININDEDKVPQNSFLVIPKCAGHKHGHICWKKDNTTYVSDGIEKAGENFTKNYQGAGDGVYAFIPCDGSITLSQEMLQQCPKLLAAIHSKQSDQPSLFTALTYASQNNRNL